MTRSGRWSEPRLDRRSAPRAEYRRTAPGLLVLEGFRCAVALPPNARDAFATGAWDTTGMLLERFGEVEATANRLPYVIGF